MELWVMPEEPEVPVESTQPQEGVPTYLGLPFYDTEHAREFMVPPSPTLVGNIIRAIEEKIDGLRHNRP